MGLQWTSIAISNRGVGEQGVGPWNPAPLLKEWAALITHYE